VNDDGIGFKRSAATEGMGLRTNHRAGMIGGNLVQEKRGGGTSGLHRARQRTGTKIEDARSTETNIVDDHPVFREGWYW
jgi:hypothetical protein